jgi:hypothetical protein
MTDCSRRLVSPLQRVARFRAEWSSERIFGRRARFGRIDRGSPGGAWTWLVVSILAASWIIVIVALAGVVPRCGPHSAPGPAIGGVMKIAGC